MKPLKAMVGGCCVCSDETGWKNNPLVYCDGHGCNVAVHQACYGIISVPSGPWFCRKCKSQKPTAQVRCQLCPLKDGALKRAVPEGWCHVLCALYIPEAEFEDVETMEPIVLEHVRSDRFGKVCYICEEQKRDPTKINCGACIQCQKVGCRQHFHVTCAQSQGLLCEESGGRGGNVKYIAYCMNHLRKLKRDSNVKVIPAFIAAPAESASSDSSPEKREREPFKLAREKKTYGKSGFTYTNSSPSFTDMMEVQEESSTTKCIEMEKLNHRSASQKIGTPKSASTVCTCKQLCTCSENLSYVSLFNSASDSRPGSGANVTSSENVFTTFERSDSILSSCSSSGIFGSAAAVYRDSGSAQQSVIVSGESDSSNSQSLPSTSLTIQGSTAETAEPMHLYPKSAVHKARKKKYGTHFSTKKRHGASKTVREADSDVSTSRDVTELINDGMHELTVSASASGTSTSGGSVFGGDPFFQKPSFLSALPSEGESPNEAPTFARPLPPASAFSPLLSESLRDNGRVPHSISELLQLQQDDTLKFLLDKSCSSEVSEMLKQLCGLKGENRELEDQVEVLMKHRDNLLSINTRLAIPLTHTDPYAVLGPEPVGVVVAAAADFPSSSFVNNDVSYIEESMPHTPEAVKTTTTYQTTYLSGKHATTPYPLQDSSRSGSSRMCDIEEQYDSVDSMPSPQGSGNQASAPAQPYNPLMLLAQHAAVYMKDTI